MTATNEIDYNSIELLRTDTHEVVIPVGMDLMDLIKWLKRRIDDEEQVVSVEHTFECFPLEGARALAETLAEHYGWTSLVPKRSFWRTDPPSVRSLRMGVGESVGVPWGRMTIPGIEGFLETQICLVKYVPVLHLYCEVKRKHEGQVRHLIHETELRLKERSIYHGQALRMEFKEFTGREDVDEFQPDFMDLRDVDVDQLVLSEHVEQMVQASLFGPVLNTEACRRHDIPLKRGNLLAGPYGCGKTLTGRVLAKLAVQSGWTFLLISNVEQLAQAVEFARRYQPCVIFSEDIDQAINGPNRGQAVNEILNVIDGIEAKQTEIMVVLTTNHAERINKAMLRPGRLDAVIPIEPPDADAAVKLVEKYCGPLLQGKAEDLIRVGHELAGQIPAVIREVCERSKLTAIASHGDADSIFPEDLLAAASGMRNQMMLLSPEPPDDRSDIEKAADRLGEHVAGVLKNGHNPLPKHNRDEEPEPSVAVADKGDARRRGFV